MATAVAEKTLNTSPPSNDPGQSAGGFLQVHKPGEGYATRLGTFVVALLFVAYACHHWYYGWGELRDIFHGIFKTIGLRFMLGWTESSEAATWVSRLGAVSLFLVGGLTCFYVVYVLTRSAEFLVKTDSELAKVTWPTVKPWFKPEAKVWGATYVVVAVLIFLTIYIMSVDWIFMSFAKWRFY